MESPLFQDLILQILQLSSGVILVVNFNGVLPGISLAENNPQMTGLRSLTCFVPDQVGHGVGPQVIVIALHHLSGMDCSYEHFSGSILLKKIVPDKHVIAKL